MKRILLIAGLLVASALAQTTTITGTLRDLTNSAVTSGKVTFTLTPSKDTTISGTARFSPQTINCLLNASGQIKAQDGTSTCTVMTNTSLQPPGSYYVVAVWPYSVKLSTFTFYAVLGTYDWSTIVPTPTTSPAANFVDVFSNQTIGGAKTFTGSLSAASFAAAAINNIVYVDGLVYTTVQQAINSFGSSPGTVIVPVEYSGPATSAASIPDNVFVWDYTVQGRPRLYVNPTTSPAGSACGIYVNNGPPNFSALGPAAGQCVVFYGAVETSAAVPTQWGSNVVLQAGPGSGSGQLTGYEADMNPIAATVASIGFLAVAAGQSQTTATETAFDCFTASNSVPLAPWKTCFTINGLSGTAFFFGPKDTGLQITQAVTSSGSPQSVSTNGSCAAPTSQLWKGELLSVDSGGTHEDVTITDAACVSNVFKITATFSQNHSNPTGFTEYGAQRLWDATSAVTQDTPYIWGSIQNYNAAHTGNVLSFGVLDASGTKRITDYFDAAGGHNWRDVGTTGYSWQNQAGGTLATLSDPGVFAVGGNTVGTTLNAGTGLYETKRAVTGCATSASAGAACVTAVAWPITIGDSSYTANCQGNGAASGAPVIGAITAKSATAVSVQTVAVTASAAQFTTIECKATHD